MTEASTPTTKEERFMAVQEVLALALAKLADAVETRRPAHEGYLAMCAQEARAALGVLEQPL